MNVWIGLAIAIPGVIGTLYATYDLRQKRKIATGPRDLVLSALDLLKPYKEEIADLRRQVSEANMRANDLNQRLFSAEQRAAQLNTRLLQAHEEVATLRAEIEELR